MKSLPVIVSIIVVVLAGLFILFNTNTKNNQSLSPSPSVTPLPSNKQVNIKARFTIITKGTTRIFTDSRYHNLSKDVYLEPSTPGIIHIKKEGLTYDDFFKTLPMKLTKDCLTTGTNQLFCTGEGGSLKFYLNRLEDKDLLDREIKEGDEILVEFK